MTGRETERLEEILNQATRAPRFSEAEVRRLSLYYAFVLKWNKRLHLTTITDPDQFFKRHINESVFAESHLSKNLTGVWDLGSGLGIPGIPIAILRPDLTVYLVDASRAKAIFLEEVISELRLFNAKVVRARLETLDRLPERSCLIARAVEKMEILIPEMLRIKGERGQMLVFGNEALKAALESQISPQSPIKSWPVPETERLWLFEL